MDVLTLIVLLAAFVLTVARLTKLVNNDVATDWLRLWAARKWGADSTVSYFLGCPWCVSLWVATIVGSVGILVANLHLHTGVSWWWLPLIAPAASHLTGLAARWLDDDVEIVDD
ncbi:hypothetical protein [Tomitella gaofuii]|uniref:hypothetical protein n=1 Tax=Tomitella gaofuii TaxID=2760083 RepID=UPI0015FB7A3A|nr:hypothetical protein [Tomitella gaofuii]